MSGVSLPEQAVRYSCVGIANSALYFVLAATLNSLTGLAAALCSVIAYVVAAALAYLAHKHLTFESRGAASREISRFVASTLLGLSLALLIPLVLHGGDPMIAFLTVLVVVPICSFLMMKFFVFRA